MISDNPPRYRNIIIPSQFSQSVSQYIAEQLTRTLLVIKIFYFVVDLLNGSFNIQHKITLLSDTFSGDIYLNKNTLHCQFFAKTFSLSPKHFGSTKYKTTLCDLITLALTQMQCIYESDCL